MLYNDIYLGLISGIEYLLPMGGRTFREGFIELSRSDRTASGRAVKDIIALKKRFTCTYEMISENDLQTILTLYLLETELQLTIRRFDDTVDKYTILLIPFDYERILITNGGLWGNVLLEMEQV